MVTRSNIVSGSTDRLYRTQPWLPHHQEGIISSLSYLEIWYGANSNVLQALDDINGSIGIYSSRLPVHAIVFIGAPHRGLQTMALETLVKSRATEDMIRELRAESPTLTELNDKFRHVAKDIDILTCYELTPTKTAIEVGSMFS